MLLQFVVSYDDLLNNGAFPNAGTTITPAVAGSPTYTLPATIIKQVNLYGGNYHVKVAGFDIFSGAMNTTTYEMNPQVIHISSSKFVFPANGVRTLSFTNNGYNSLPSLNGQREFEISAISGNIDLTIQINQFGQNINANTAAVVAPYTIDKTATWTSAQFAYFILSLELTEHDMKEKFSEHK